MDALHATFKKWKNQKNESEQMVLAIWNSLLKERFERIWNKVKNSESLKVQENIFDKKKIKFLERKCGKDRTFTVDWRVEF